MSSPKLPAKDWLTNLSTPDHMHPRCLRATAPNKPFFEQLLDLLCAILVLVAVGLYGALLF